MNSMLTRKSQSFMSMLFMLFVFVIGCCREEHKSNFHDFSDNASEKDIYQDVRDIALKYDFSIIFFTRAQLSYNWYKIFSVKNNKWTKIEIRQNILDTARQKYDHEYFTSRDIVTRKGCRPEEANAFLSKLKKYNLFTLPEEEEIHEKCKPSGIYDVETIYIQIVSRCKVRSLKYYDTYGSARRCPDVKELAEILAVQQLFEEEW